jgi:hypothetical protein
MTEVASASMPCENSGTIPVSCVPYALQAPHRRFWQLSAVR